MTAMAFQDMSRDYQATLDSNAEDLEKLEELKQDVEIYKDSVKFNVTDLAKFKKFIEGHDWTTEL